MAEKENIQEVLLEKFKSEGTELTVFLLNGFQMNAKRKPNEKPKATFYLRKRQINLHRLCPQILDIEIRE